MRRKKKAVIPRVLFVGAFPPAGATVFGGMVSSCRALLQSSFTKRLDLVLVDTTQISNPPPHFVIRMLLAAKRFALFLAKFERSKPDAVLLFASVGASVLEKGSMAWYARLRGVPAAIFPRGGVLIDACRASRFTRAWVRAALRGSRTMLCQGPTWRHFAISEMGFAEGQAVVIFNWTATPNLLAVGRARIFGGELRPPRLIFVGWLERKKGIFELLQACANLLCFHKFELNIVGEGTASGDARQFVADNRLESVVSFSGWLEEETLVQAYADADVLVLPSWAEGLPNVMIEAMAAKLAVVVSAVGNVPDVVTDGHDVLIVPPRDVPSLQAALARVISDPHLRQRLAEAALVSAESKFSVERAADSLVAALGKNIT